MKKRVLFNAAIILAVAGIVYAAQDTALTQREVRDPIKLESWLETNASDAQTRLTAVEAGTVSGLNVSGTSTFNNSVTAISTNDATTNVIVTVDGELDGETLENDSVDDDAIDFSDVTGADLTLTDCTAITASGDITANGNLVGDGSTIVTNIAELYIGSTVGISATITNIGFGSTNILVYTKGVLTSATTNP